MTIAPQNETSLYSQRDIRLILERTIAESADLAGICKDIGTTEQEAVAILKGGEEGRLAYAAWFIRQVS
jgi:hypothetical protein